MRLVLLAVPFVFVACSVTATVGPDTSDGGSDTPDGAAAKGDSGSITDDGGGGNDGGTSSDATTNNDASQSGGCGPGMLDAGGGACTVPPMLPVTNQGGGSLAAMELWTVVWQGDETTGATIDKFHKDVFASTWWTTALGEYGVTGGTAKGLITLGAPPASMNDQYYASTVIPSLEGMTATNGTPFTLNANTVIAMIIPKTTTEPVGSPYHDETQSKIGGYNVPYIVLRQDSFPGLADADNLTWSESHEMVETASDPHFNPGGWYNATLAAAGEIGDLCNDIPVKETLNGTQYNVTRVYSAKAAAAQKGDSCYPGVGTGYANIAVSPLAITVPASGSAQVTLHAFSDGSTASMHWNLYADQSFTISPNTGDLAPGQKDVTVTITRGAKSPNYPTVLNMWIGPDNASIPSQESFAALQ